MSRYRQQLAKARAATASTRATTLRRTVHPGEPINGQVGEELDVVSDIEGTQMLVARVRVQEDGVFRLGTDRGMSA